MRDTAHLGKYRQGNTHQLWRCANSPAWRAWRRRRHGDEGGEGGTDEEEAACGYIGPFHSLFPSQGPFSPGVVSPLRLVRQRLVLFSALPGRLMVGGMQIGFTASHVIPIPILGINKLEKKLCLESQGLARVHGPLDCPHRYGQNKPDNRQQATGCMCRRLMGEHGNRRRTSAFVSLVV